jgi:hypothetical protein
MSSSPFPRELVSIGPQRGRFLIAMPAPRWGAREHAKCLSVSSFCSFPWEGQSGNAAPGLTFFQTRSPFVRTNIKRAEWLDRLHICTRRRRDGRNQGGGRARLTRVRRRNRRVAPAPRRFLRAAGRQTNRRGGDRRRHPDWSVPRPTAGTTRVSLAPSRIAVRSVARGLASLSVSISLGRRTRQS